jgi:hypothetical protein
MAHRMTPTLFDGHEPDVIHANIRLLVGEGYRQSAACLAALLHARRAYRVEFPRGGFPAHLKKKPKSKKAKKAKKEDRGLV